MTKLAPLFLCTALAGTAFAEGKTLAPGKWAISVTMEMEGMGKMQPMVQTKCMTGDQVKSPEAIVAAMQQKQRGDCQLKDVKVVGSTISWAMECAGKGAGSGSITLGGGVFHGLFTMETAGKDGKPHKGTITLDGKRVGDCP
jgi:Protein of unknown function (DUF3617)